MTFLDAMVWLHYSGSKLSYAKPFLTSLEVDLTKHLYEVAHGPSNVLLVDALLHERSDVKHCEGLEPEL